MTSRFEVAGEIIEIETIARGTGIRELPLLRRRFGQGRWRKLKGVAKVRLRSGKIRLPELHWYEAHGIGRRKMKIKQFLNWKLWQLHKDNSSFVSTMTDTTI